MRIAGFDAVGDAAAVRLAVECDETSRHGTIHCSGVRRWAFDDGPVHPIGLTDDHPALLLFAERQGDLYFTGAPENPHRLALALRAEHELIERYLPFRESFCTGFGARHLEGGHGHVARGPLSRLEVYAELLRREGSKPRILPSWRDPTPHLHALELGDSYVVGAEFRPGDDLLRAVGELAP
ncbi:MAG TPA: hypothetical protein VHF45_11140 [Thermoleophilaceae bacterium]|nr:hypothetical protein [Thermoleophilaceae bacterium]